MNTKYPLNGRVTTLADLVHEYGANSFWIDDSSYVLYGTLNSTSVLPFLKLVFNETLDINNNFVAENPYEIVYFNTVYSSTEKDISGKHMKVILADDSTAFDGYPGSMNLDEYIKAGDVVNATTITKGKYGFKFILASKDKNNQYYYNYKTSSGEATVMYALRNIINILNDNNINFNKDNNLYKKIFINISNNDYENIFKINNGNIIGLNENAYKYLGDFIWTYKYVDIPNYTTNEANLVSNLLKNKFLNSTRKPNNSIFSFLYLLSDDIKKTSKNYAYNISDNAYKKIEFYLNIFLNSQRFFVSYVTGFRFGKISNKSYLQIDPVLRCDLGQLMIYDKIEITNYEHDPTTALTAGPLSLSTSITVNIVYKAKYKNTLQYTNSITYPLIISFQDFKKDINNNDNVWYTLRNVTFEDPEKSISDGGYSEYININGLREQGKHKYGTQYFPEFGSINTYSLSNKKWPLNESLLITDRSKFDSIKNKPSISLKNYANTADITTFQEKKGEGISKTRETCKNFIDSNVIHPFGVLRIHNELNNETEQNILNTSFYIDVSLYRCKNYYIKVSSNAQDINNANINIYYNPLYTNYSYLPQITIDSSMSDNPEETKENLDKWFNDTNDKKYTISRFSNYEYYILLNTNTGDLYEYASGVIANDIDSNISSYTNDLEPNISYLNNSKWVEYTGTDIIYATRKLNNLYNTYTLNFLTYDNSHIFIEYWKINFKQINKYFYIKRNYPRGNNFVNISTLYVTDFNKNTPEFVLSNGTKNSGISLSFLLYNNKNDNNDNLQIFTISMLNQSNNIINNITNENELSTLYIEPVNFKILDYNSYSYYYNTLSSNNTNSIFYVAYETVILEKIHYFSFKSIKTLFTENKNSRFVELNNIKKYLPCIYIALNPIYIFNIDSTITKAEKSDINDDLLSLFKNILLKNIYNLMADNSISSLEGPGENSNYICYSIYNTVQLTHLSILIEQKNLYEHTLTLKSKYMFSFNIIVYQLNNDNTWNNNWTTVSGENIININNSSNQDTIDTSLKNINFIGSKAYKISLELVTLKPRTEELNVSFYANSADYDTFITITIILLPTGYQGTTKTGTLGTGSRMIYNIPYGSTIKIINSYKPMDKNDTTLWQGWGFSWLNNDPDKNIKDKEYQFILNESINLKASVTSIGIYAGLFKSNNNNTNTDTEQKPDKPSISFNNNIVTINKNTLDMRITTYYTDDGSDPASSSTKKEYSSSISLNPNDDMTITTRNCNINNSIDFLWSDKAELHVKYTEQQP